MKDNKFFKYIKEQFFMIFKIFRHDVKRLSTNIIACIVIIGICVLPALYAWFNIAANWDPYGRTAGISVAVSNEDKGCTIENINIALGNEIVKNLEANNMMGWTFVNTEDAKEGVKSGKYYAAVVIPEDFSEKMTSFLTSDIERPEINYYVNQKKNAIAPKITDKGIEAIQTQVDESFINTIASYVATLLNTTGGKIESVEQDVLSRVISDLDDLDTSLTEFEGHVDTYSSTIDTVVGLLTTNKNFLPSLQDTLASAGDVTTSSEEAAEAVESSVESLADGLETIVNSTEALYSSVSSGVTSALETADSDMDAAASGISGTTIYCQQIISVNNEIITTISALGDKFGIDVSAFVNELENSNAIQQNMIDELNNAANQLRSAGAAPLDNQEKLNELVSQTESSLAGIKSSYTEKAKPAIQKGISIFFSEMKSVDGLLSRIDDEIPQMESTIDSLCSTLNSVKEGMSGLKTVASDGKDRITKFKEKVTELKNNQKISKLLDMIQKNPEKIAEFFSAPVQVSEESFYEIENYGSAMSPFYSTLAIWVGGIVLVAILKVKVKREDEIQDVSPTAAYFGRMLIFLALGLIQALVIALGDLYFLQIQCLYPSISYSAALPPA